MTVILFLLLAVQQDSVAVTATWQPATDDVGVVEYVYNAIVLSGTTPDTTVTFVLPRPTIADDSLTFCVRARDAAGNEGLDVCAAFVVLVVQDTIAPSSPGNVTIEVSIASVPPPPPSSGEPEFDSGIHTMLFEDDYESYADSDAMKAVYVTKNVEFTQLAIAGGRSNSKAWRIDWPDDSSRGCSDREVVFEKNLDNAAEVFLQFYIKYDSGFRFRWSGDPCNGNAKKIWFFWRAGAGADRWAFWFENSDFVIGYESVGLRPPNVGGAITKAEVADGTFHKYTFHLKAESSAAANDGIMKGWLDGVLRWDYENQDTDGTNAYTLFKFPTTFNKGSPQAQQEWRDDLKVWK